MRNSLCVQDRDRTIGSNCFPYNKSAGCRSGGFNYNSNYTDHKRSFHCYSTKDTDSHNTNKKDLDCRLLGAFPQL